MCASNLSEVFKSCVSEFAGDIPDSVFADFETAVRNRKYDIQDKAIIEAVLKREADSLKHSFSESFGVWLKKNEPGNWNAAKSAKVSGIFLASLETLIDYFYNKIITGQFSA